MAKQAGSKSGYEIREGLLGMAIGILSESNSRQFDNEHLKPECERKPVTPFTTENVIVEAEKLYQFVQNDS
jgi:hypothetical protein